MKQKLLSALKKTSNTQQKKRNFYNIPRIIDNLETALINHKYKTGIFSCFVVKYPKIREIFAPDFKDRIVHHLLIEMISKEIDKTFIFHSCANRKNKWVFFWVKQLQKMMKNHHNKYFLQMDIKNFFPSIDKNILWKLIKFHIEKLKTLNEEEKYFCKLNIYKIITQNIFDPYIIFTGNKELLKSVPKQKSLFHTPKLKWLPIWSLTSQFFANVYLNELDRYVKHTLKIKNYIRYVDDFVILWENKEELLKYQWLIEDFVVKHLALEIHKNKTLVDYTNNWVDFLGFIVKKDVLLVRKRTIKIFKRKLYFFNHLIDPTRFPIKDIPENTTLWKKYLAWNISAPIEISLSILQKMLAVINSYYWHINFWNSFYLRKNIYQKHFHHLKKYFVPKNPTFQAIKIREKYKK